MYLSLRVTACFALIASTMTFKVGRQFVVQPTRLHLPQLRNDLKMLGIPSILSVPSSATRLHSTLPVAEPVKKVPNPAKTFKKLFPLGAMLFFILFNYTILRDTKDVLVVTAAGAEIIPFLKVTWNHQNFELTNLNNVHWFHPPPLFFICMTDLREPTSSSWLHCVVFGSL